MTRRVSRTAVTVAAFACLALVAPTAAPAHAAGSSTATSIAQQATAKAKATGVLKIVIKGAKGIPSARVVIRSGKKHWVVKKTRSLSLPAGSYSIEVPKVNLAGGLLVSPSLSRSKVTVLKGKTSGVTADFGNRTSVPVTSFPASAVFVPAPGVGDADAIPGLPLITIPTAATIPDGHFIQVPAGSPGFPYGFTGKALSTSPAGILAEYVPISKVYPRVSVEAAVPLNRLIMSAQPKAGASPDSTSKCDTPKLTAALKSVTFAKEPTVSFTSGTAGGSAGFKMITYSGARFDTFAAQCNVTLTTTVPLGIPGLVFDGTFNFSTKSKSTIATSLGVTTVSTFGFTYKDSTGPEPQAKSGASMRGKKPAAADVKSIEATALASSMHSYVKFPYMAPAAGVLDGVGRIGVDGTLNSGVLTSSTSLEKCTVEKSWDAVMKFKAGAVASLGLTPGAWATPLTTGGVITKDLGAATPQGKECLLSGETASNPAEKPVASSKPTALKATKGSSSVSLAWTAPTEGAAPTDYKVEQSIDNGATWTVVTHAALTSPALKVESLTPGKSYVFRVSAVTSAGTSEPSASSEAVIPYTFPGKPTDVKAVVSSTTAEVSWVAPTSDGYTPLTGYSVEYKLSTATAWTAKESAVGTVSASITGLVSGSTYLFQVSAVNAAGKSEAAAAANSSSSSGLTMSAPTVALTGTAGQLNVSFTAPSGVTPASYDLQWKPAGGSWTTVTGVTSPHAKTGLTDGTGYEFQVRAKTASATGDWSPSGAGTPLAAPAAPAVESATGSLTATWAAVTGATGYVLEWSTTAGFATVTGNVSFGDVRTGQATGLTSGTPYYARVRATNAGGMGPASLASTAVTPLVAPTALQVAYTSATSVTPTWTASAGATSYQMTVYDGGSGTWSAPAAFVSGSVYATGLVSGGTYGYRVRALAGAGSYSDWAPTVSLAMLAAPGTPAVSSANPGEITATFTPTTGAGSYKVEWSTSATFATVTGSYEVVGSPALISSLAVGSYYVRVTGVTPGGVLGAASVISSVVAVASGIL